MNKDWIDINVLEDYLDGKLDAKAMNRVEREALEDPFVAEALAGLSHAPKRSLESISLLQKQLQERIAEHQQSRKASVITWQRLSIAATAAVLFISIGIIFWMKQNNYQDMLAKQPKKVDVSLAPRVFKDSIIKARVIDKAIAVSKSEEAIAATIKPKIKAVPVAEPAPVEVATEPAPELNEVTVTAAPQARQKSVAFSATSLNNSDGTKTVSGRVIDLKTGAPLPNAGIYFGTPMRAVGAADQNGNYTVTVPADATDLTFTFTGYENQHVKITGNSFDVAMKEMTNQLEDVVIRGYQKRSREQTTGSSFIVTGKEAEDVPVANVEQLLQGKVAGLNIASIAQPSNGWNKFRAYLIKNNRFSNETKPGQTAEYKFIIKHGRPANITTVNGVSENYDEEAIRLIKNGPSWKLPDPTRFEVKVVLKF